MYFQTYRDFRNAETKEQMEYIIEKLNKNNDCLIQTNGDELMYEGHAIIMHMDIEDDKLLDRVMAEKKSVSTFCDKDTSLITIENLVYQNVKQIAEWLGLSKDERESKFKDTNGKLAITGYAGGYIGRGIRADLSEINTPLLTMVLNVNPMAETFFNIRTAYPDITKDVKWCKENLEGTHMKWLPQKTEKNYKKEVLEKIKKKDDLLNKIFWAIKIAYPQSNPFYNEKYNAVYCNFADKNNEYIIRFTKERKATLGIKNTEGKYTIVSSDNISIPKDTKALINDVLDVEKNIYSNKYIDKLKNEIVIENESPKAIPVPKQMLDNR